MKFNHLKLEIKNFICYTHSLLMLKSTIPFSDFAKLDLRVGKKSKWLREAEKKVPAGTLIK